MGLFGRKKPDDERVWINKGLAEYSLGGYAEAERCFGKVKN